MINTKFWELASLERGLNLDSDETLYDIFSSVCRAGVVFRERQRQRDSEKSEKQDQPHDRKIDKK